ncbi:tetratricopeptide repeat protein, partial [Candidatus Omnitrophota bacterium]
MTQKQRYTDMRKIAVFLVVGVFILQAAFFADSVWKGQLSGLVSAGEEVKKTDRDQFDYISKLAEENEIEKAINACNDFIKSFPQSSLASDAYFTLGKLQESQDEHYKAFTSYQHIVKEYPHVAYMEELLDRQFTIGLKFFEGERLRIGGVPTMPSQTKAIEIFEAIKKNAPFSEYGEKAQFYIGLSYEKMKDYEEAMTAFNDLLEEYPTTEFASEASFKMADLVYKTAQRNLDNETLLDSAEEKFDEFIATYPNNISAIEEASSRKKQLLEEQAERLYKIGRFYENQRHLESAKIYYALIINKYP